MIRIFTILLTFSLFMTLTLTGKAQSWKREIRAFQKDLNQHYRDPDASPLTAEDRVEFKKHDFFPMNEALRFEARIERTPEADAFQMATVSGKFKTYRKWANLRFDWNGRPYQLAAYRQISKKSGEESDYLFVPFRDESSGNESYGGGRYIDLEIPEEGDQTLVLDFNQAYNPYCAYSSGWSCPIPPEENFLEFKVLAGVMAWKHGHAH